MPEAEEWLDVVRPDGSPTGRRLTRADVHRRGAWHRTRTVWVVLTHGPDAPALVLQQRGLAKDTWPGRLDASSAGHLRPGDADAWRELHEELGLRPRRGPLLRLGERRSQVSHPNGVVDRELQDLWLWLAPHTLADLRPARGEVAALLSVRLAHAAALARTDERGAAAPRPAAAVLPARRLTPDGRLTAAAVLPADLPPGMRPYTAHIAALARQALDGNPTPTYDPTFDA